MARRARRVRDVRVDDQFAIASVTKSVIAAQVMQMVEAGDLNLADLAADHRPADLDFETNGATIRHLLGQRSGIPYYLPVVNERLLTDPQRLWKPAELLELVDPCRAPVGELRVHEQQVRGRPIAEVLRDGVLSIDGIAPQTYQPDESPGESYALRALLLPHPCS